MCLFTDRLIGLMPYCFQDSQDNLLPRKIKARFKRVKPSRCLICGKKMSYHELWPIGKCSRSLCLGCYNHWILARSRTGYINYCFICGDQLPHYKVNAIKSNPREIGKHMHDGNCMDSFTIMHNIIVGNIDHYYDHLRYSHCLENFDHFDDHWHLNIPAQTKSRGVYRYKKGLTFKKPKFLHKMIEYNPMPKNLTQLFVQSPRKKEDELELVYLSQFKN